MTELQKIEKAAAKAASSREALQREICIAYQRGASLRAISEAAKMSHESVRSIIRHTRLCQ